MQIIFADNVLMHFVDKIKDKKFLKLLWKRAPLQKIKTYHEKLKIIKNIEINTKQALSKFGKSFFLEILKNNNLDLDGTDIENIQNLKDEIKEVSCYHLSWLLDNVEISTKDLTLFIWRLEDFKTLYTYFEEKEINPSFKDFVLELKLLKNYNTLFSSILLSRYNNELYQFTLDLITKILKDTKFNTDVQEKLLEADNFDYNTFQQFPNDIKIKLFKEATKFNKFMDLQNKKTIYEIVEFNDSFTKKDAQQFLVDSNRLVLLDECISEINKIPSKLIKNWDDFLVIKESYSEKFDDDIFKHMVKMLDDSTTYESETHFLALAIQKDKIQELITIWPKESLPESSYEIFELKKYIIPLKLWPIEWNEDYKKWSSDGRFEHKIKHNSFEKMENFYNKQNIEYNEAMEYTRKYISDYQNISSIVKFKKLKNVKDKIGKLIEEGYHNWDNTKTLRKNINIWNKINNNPKKDNNKNN